MFCVQRKTLLPALHRFVERGGKILSLFICLGELSAQEFSQVQIKTVGEDSFLIRYSLSGLSEVGKCDVSLKLKTPEGHTLIARTLSGDYQWVSNGENKLIMWDAGADNYSLRSPQLTAELSASRVYKKKIVGGPDNAWLSIPVPGLGNYFVALKNREFWFLSTVFCYGTLGVGIFDLLKADEYASRAARRDNVTIREEEEALANTLRTTGTVLLISSLTMWTVSVIHAYIKGKRNRDNQQYRVSWGIVPLSTFPHGSTPNTVGISLTLNL